MKLIKDIRREKLAQLVQNHGGQSAFATAIDKDRNQVHQWLLPADNPNSRNLSEKTARHIESIFDLHPGWLDTDGNKVHGYEIEAIDGNDGTDSSKEIMVAEVDAQVAAGDGQTVEFVETKYRLSFQIEWLRSIGVRHAKDVVLMPVHGNSMERTIFDGDKVLVHLTQKRIISDSVYAIMLDCEPRIKRLFNTGEGVRIVSDNEDKIKYPDDLVTPETAERLIIIGRAIHRQGSKGL